MSLLLLNLVYVNQADSEWPGVGGGAGLEVGRGVVGGVRGAANRRDGARGKARMSPPLTFSSSFLFKSLLSLFCKCICHHGVNRCSSEATNSIRPCG